METNKKLKTRDIADSVIEKYAEKIEESWMLEHNQGRYHKAFDKFKEFAKEVIGKKYGKRVAQSYSAQFYGYVAHYVYSYCVSKYGRNF